MRSCAFASAETREAAFSRCWINAGSFTSLAWSLSILATIARDLLEQHLVALKRGLEASFVALALNGHSQEVGRALEEGNVMSAELILRPAVDLQYPKWPTLSLQNDIHGTPNPGFCK